jgi:hypothetical protein
MVMETKHQNPKDKIQENFKFQTSWGVACPCPERLDGLGFWDLEFL